MTTKIQSNVPDELAQSLAFVAENFKRSQSYIICEAVTNYVKEALEDYRDLQDALAREKASTRQYVSMDEMETFIESNCHDR